ncbi:MAG: hypothetical protein JXR84_07245 [Anaerolineae bacterium]|nr:hypothetical protein [Anaerolineae bacterium]
MGLKKIYFIPLLSVYLLISLACAYIVLPEGLEQSSSTYGSNRGWAGIVTQVGETVAGDLRIDITIRNDTGVWSAMRAADGKPALLSTGDGKTASCATVFVGTGGHRLAPGFQMCGYTSAQSGQAETQLLYVECTGAVAAPGSKLTIDYVRFDGDLDYYVEVAETNKIAGKLVLNLDEVVTDLTYPIGEPVADLIQDSKAEMIALSDNIVNLLDVQRQESGFHFTWQNVNPSKFALKTHIGIPPVIGADGIIYGVYETLDMADVPLTPAQGSVTWDTEVAVPADVDTFYILLSVESKKPRTYVNYALEITGE